MVTLSPRQIEVCKAIAACHSDKDIAGDLGITEDGVRWHVRILFAKTRCRSRLELTQWFLLLSEDAVRHRLLATEAQRLVRKPLRKQ